MSPSESGAETKVGQLDVSVCIDQDVVRFNISMDKSHFVNTIYSTHQLADIEPEIELIFSKCLQLMTIFLF